MLAIVTFIIYDTVYVCYIYLYISDTMTEHSGPSGIEQGVTDIRHDYQGMTNYSSRLPVIMSL